MAKVTINDVAREANVSVGTVYRAVNNTGRISKETRMRVLEMVERLGYKANSIARGLALRSKFNILVIMPRLPDIFWNDVMIGTRRAESELSEFGVQIIEFYHDYGKTGSKTVMDVISGQKVDAIAMSVVNFSDSEKVLSYAIENKIPVAVFNEDTVWHERLFFYGPDNHLAGRMAAELMYKFCRPEGTYCIITSKSNLPAGKEDTNANREKSFLEYMGQYAQNLRSIGTFRCTTDESPLAIRQIIKDNPEIDGFYFVTFNILYRNYQLLGKLKKKYVVIGHEYNEVFRDALQDGTITALLSQEKVCQGYYPVIMLYNYLMTGEIPSQDTYYSNINIIIGSNVNCLHQNKYGCGYE